ncbi:unnamed protein product [Phytophthora fragariaefolia]|uniref:Unnamed protein product n=1 Tax=Phytophthora fragariaefolia TaxID=1490495 RepID=A0A9W6Y8W3_9STRA|nr:unnamed protein product [Phytophthora fragariaefolia]
MPKQSDRQRLLREVGDILAVGALDEEDNEILMLNESDEEAVRLLFSDTNEANELLQLVQSSCYLVDRERAVKSTVFDADAFRCYTSDHRFRDMTRMDRNTFERVVGEIKNHRIFQNNSYCGQAAVWKPLAVAIGRFANYGTGASLSGSERLWGIAKGTVDDYTNRVVMALNDLSGRYVRRPTPEERRRSSRHMASLGFRGCVGFIDGTTIPLAQKPGKDGECFFLSETAL